MNFFTKMGIQFFFTGRGLNAMINSCSLNFIGRSMKYFEQLSTSIKYFFMTIRGRPFEFKHFNGKQNKMQKMYVITKILHAHQPVWQVGAFFMMRFSVR